MIYNVAGLLGDPVGSIRRHAIEDERLFGERHAFEGISGPVKLLKTDQTVLVSAEITATAQAMCSRCLETAIVGINARLEEEFLPINSDMMGAPGQPGEGDAEPIDPVLLIGRRNSLDLSGALVDALEVSMPIAPLCRPSCLGLCPVCSTNRNNSHCECVENPIEARWQALAELTPGNRNSTT